MKLSNKEKILLFLAMYNQEMFSANTVASVLNIENISNDWREIRELPFIVDYNDMIKVSDDFTAEWIEACYKILVRPEPLGIAYRLMIAIIINYPNMVNVTELITRLNLGKMGFTYLQYWIDKGTIGSHSNEVEQFIVGQFKYYKIQDAIDMVVESFIANKYNQTLINFAKTA